LLLNNEPTIGRRLRIGTAEPSDWELLFNSPAIANDCPSRSSTSVSARLVVRAGIRNPEIVTPLLKSSALTSGLTCSRMTFPAMVGLNLSRTPNSFHVTDTVPAAPDTNGTGNSPPARKLAS